MTPELFSSMVTAWFEVYSPIIQAGVIGMVTASMLLAVLVFVSLLLRNVLGSGMRNLS